MMNHKAIQELFAREGSNSWFIYEALRFCLKVMPASEVATSERKRISWMSGLIPDHPMLLWPSPT